MLVHTLSERIEQFSGWCILLSGWSRAGVAFLSGALSAFAMAPFDLVPVLLFTFPILIWLLDGAASDAADGFFQRLKDSFKPGFFFGFGYFLAGLWWIGHAFLIEAESFAWALPFAVAGVPFILALFWGAATALSRLFWSGSIFRICILAASFALFEYLRSFIATGFPWNTIGYAAYPLPVLMQSASIFGIYAMSAIVVFVACVPVALFQTAQNSGFLKISMLLAVVALISGHFGYGMMRMSGGPSAFVESVSIRIIQPNINQADKFDPAKEQEIFNTYLKLSTSPGKNGKAGLSGTTHLIWPESAFPFFLTQRRDALAAISAMLPDETTLITGGVRFEVESSADSEPRVFNSTLVVNEKGEVVAAADKMQLVPFGEYLPFQSLLESFGIEQLTQQQGGFEAGSSRQPLTVGNAPPFLPLICYEIIFPGKSPQAEVRPEWIINLTNDAWFGNTPGPYQHLRQSIIRGVIDGVPVIRSANSGISVVTDAYGREISRMGLGEKSVIDTGLPEAIEPTLYSRHGTGIFWAVFFGFFVVGCLPVIFRRQH